MLHSNPPALKLVSPFNGFGDLFHHEPTQLSIGSGPTLTLLVQ